MDTDEFYMRAFWDLSTCRQMGMSIGAIPWNFIRDYGNTKGLDEENLEAFLEIILTMDRVFLEWELEEVERRRKEKK